MIVDDNLPATVKRGLVIVVEFFSRIIAISSADKELILPQLGEKLRVLAKKWRHLAVIFLDQLSLFLTKSQ